MMSSKLDVIKVNKYQTGWDARVIFAGFSIRATLAGTQDIITRISKRHRLFKRLSREAGLEGSDWMVFDHPDTGDVELYLNDMGVLIMWKLQDHEVFDKMFSRIEQHVDDAPGD